VDSGADDWQPVVPEPTMEQRVKDYEDRYKQTRASAEVYKPIRKPAETSAPADAAEPTTPDDDLGADTGMEARVKRYMEDKAAAAKSESSTTKKSSKTTKTTTTTPEATAAPEPSAAEKSNDDDIDNDDLETELRDARSLYSRAKEGLDRREAIEAIANGLGRIGAGLYGKKTGTDMGKVEFDRKDWDKKRGLEQGDFQTTLGDISERRRQQVQNAQFEKSMGQRDKEFGVTTELTKTGQTESERHNKATEAIGRLNAIYGFKAAVLSADARASKTADAASDKRTKDIKRAKTEIQKTLINKNLDEDMKVATVKGILVNDLGVDEDRAQEIVIDGGLWDSLNDGDEILASLNQISDHESVARTLVTVSKGGHSRQVTPADAAKLKSKGWDVAE
jgi:hypothetical protein